jgi:hypothetical protein
VEEEKTAAAAKLLETHIRFKGESFWASADMIQSMTSSARGGRARLGRATRRSSPKALLSTD